MSMTFTKLFSSITESTVWCEPSDVRIVWIAMLAMADKHGRVWGSIPGLANRARVPVESARTAIESFLSPDKDSRTKDFEGRRIREIDGGWVLLNYGKYRSIRDEEERRAYKAAKQRQYRAKGGQDGGQTPPPTDKPKRGQKRGQSGQMLNNVDSGGHNADAEADAFKKATTPLPPKSTQTDADGDAPASPPKATLVPFPKNPLGNPEIYTLANLVAMATPWAVMRSLRLEDVTHSQRVAVITAAKTEAQASGLSVAQSLDGLLKVIEHQVSNMPHDRLQFQGTIETYMKNHTYRVDPTHLAGGNNGKSKGEIVDDATRTVLANIARKRRHGSAEDGAPERSHLLGGSSRTLR